jgi:hypothetical protein
MNTVPPTRAEKPPDRLSRFVVDAIAYANLSRSAVKYLQARRRGHPKLFEKLMIQAEFCFQMLVTMLGVSPQEVARVEQLIVKDPKFVEEVEKFADHMSPDKSVLISPENCMKEASRLKRI